MSVRREHSQSPDPSNSIGKNGVDIMSNGQMSVPSNNEYDQWRTQPQHQIYSMTNTSPQTAVTGDYVTSFYPPSMNSPNTAYYSNGWTGFYHPSQISSAASPQYGPPPPPPMDHPQHHMNLFGPNSYLFGYFPPNSGGDYNTWGSPGLLTSGGGAGGQAAQQAGGRSGGSNPAASMNRHGTDFYYGSSGMDGYSNFVPSGPPADGRGGGAGAMVMVNQVEHGMGRLTFDDHRNAGGLATATGAPYGSVGVVQQQSANLSGGVGSGGVQPSGPPKKTWASIVKQPEKAGSSGSISAKARKIPISGLPGGMNAISSSSNNGAGGGGGQGFWSSLPQPRTNVSSQMTPQQQQKSSSSWTPAGGNRGKSAVNSAATTDGLDEGSDENHQVVVINANNNNNGSANNSESEDNSNFGGKTSGVAKSSPSVVAGQPQPHNPVLDKLRMENEYNPKEFTLPTKGARYFVIKSYNEDDFHRSIKYGIWCSTEHGNKRLDQAYKEREGKGPIYVFASVNGSGHFCGVAQMTSMVDYGKSTGVWAQDKYKGQFTVKWIYVKDVPNNQLRHIRLENNENKPVTNSRDTQEVPADKGRQVLKVIHAFQHTTSLFDDFTHYEKREKEEDERKVKGRQQD